MTFSLYIFQSNFDLIEDEEVFDRLAIIRSTSKNLLQSISNA